MVIVQPLNERDDVHWRRYLPPPMVNAFENLKKQMTTDICKDLSNMLKTSGFLQVVGSLKLQCAVEELVQSTLLKELPVNVAANVGNVRLPTPTTPSLPLHLQRLLVDLTHTHHAGVDSGVFGAVTLPQSVNYGTHYSPTYLLSQWSNSTATAGQVTTGDVTSPRISITLGCNPHSRSGGALRALLSSNSAVLNINIVPHQQQHEQHDSTARGSASSLAIATTPNAATWLDCRPSLTSPTQHSSPSPMVSLLSLPPSPSQSQTIVIVLVDFVTAGAELVVTLIRSIQCTRTLVSHSADNWSITEDEVVFVPCLDASHVDFHATHHGQSWAHLALEFMRRWNWHQESAESLSVRTTGLTSLLEVCFGFASLLFPCLTSFCLSLTQSRLNDTPKFKACVTRVDETRASTAARSIMQCKPSTVRFVMNVATDIDVDLHKPRPAAGPVIQTDTAGILFLIVSLSF